MTDRSTEVVADSLDRRIASPENTRHHYSALVHVVHFEGDVTRYECCDRLLHDQA